MIRELWHSAVIHAIAGDRRDLYLGWPERFFVRLNSLLPHLVDRGSAQAVALIRRFSQKPDERDTSSHEKIFACLLFATLSQSVPGRWRPPTSNA